MTTLPKAKKYRVRAPKASAETEQPEPAAKPTKKSDPVEAIKQIEAEGLTPKQLRLARRNAQRHGLEPASDYDAVRMLRNHDLDPFEAPRSLRVVRDAKYQEGKDLPAEGAARSAPGPQLLTTDAQAESIRAIQRDIVRRRRRNFALLVMRLCFFILLPTMLAGYYFYTVATPMYATKTEFVIQQSESSGARGGGGLFSGTGMATQLDSLNVQGYLQSREAMLRLNEDLDFKSHYQQEHIDPIRRLPADASDEKAYKFYKRNVRISYDTTEGIVKMEIIAADAETSKAFALALIGYAEERIDRLTERMREDQMRGAREHFAEAEAQLRAAQQEFLTLQKQKSVFDADAETGRVMGQVSSFETELTEKRLTLQQLLSNPDPSAARVNGLRSDIARLEGIIAELRSSLIEEIDGAESLASVLAELTISEMNMETRQAMVTAALEEMENARVEANRQTRFLSMSVNPILPDEAAYPRAFENTFLTLLIFSGVYLMISITAAVLREQLAG
ncbi:capsule biosynthesis protein [Actibacterium pelagium]|uniref:Capsule polysaccharide transporter n=1 Tax=Actibacterium pelagium TaxID=2029103 RepID=A0A917AF03_9RHOB|nr:capsule biosynthesis protein [Actibacterium pelagium]GGE48249.1 capsule polysaccharide transporter [Actibacterium pelagium]